MTLRNPARSWGAAKALIVLIAAGLLLGGCHGYRAYSGGPHYAQPHYGKHYDPGKGKRDGHHRRRGGHRGGRGWR